MSDEIKVEPDTATTVVEPGGNGVAIPAVDQIKELLMSLPEEQRPFMNKDEVVSGLKEIRELRKQVAELSAASAAQKPPEKKEPGAKPGEFDAVAFEERMVGLFTTFKEGLTSKESLGDAVRGSGLTISDSQRKIVETMYASEKPENAKAWLAKLLPEIGVVGEKPAETVAAVVKQPAINAGAATREGGPHVLPVNPNEVDMEVLRSMAPDDRQAYMKTWLNKGGQSNPFVSGKKRHK
ncbi:MAG: hypothetical protein ACTSX8_08475 [Alphaproteobacteria bacterium]